jgi:hypothetical protein
VDRPADTSDDVHQRQLAVIAALPPSRRVEQAVEMSELARQISSVGAARRQSISPSE